MLTKCIENRNLVAIFYILMIRPQKKRADKEREYVAALQKGTEIYTKSGMLGTMTGMTEKVITVEISEGIKVKVLKGQIGGLASKIFETKDSDKK